MNMQSFKVKPLEPFSNNSPEMQQPQITYQHFEENPFEICQKDKNFVLLSAAILSSWNKINKLSKKKTTKKLSLSVSGLHMKICIHTLKQKKIGTAEATEKATFSVFSDEIMREGYNA